MFTGIVEDIGQIVKINRKNKDYLFVFCVNKIDMSEVVIGESISVNGICLTVTSIGSKDFTVDVSEETISKTNLSYLQLGSRVNLERSVKVGERMSGHFVTGHIDGVGKIDSIVKKGDSFELWVRLSSQLSKYSVEKGSIAVDGVSLTINQVKGDKFSVNIIPHTQKETIFSDYVNGSVVNVECDIIGKYVERFIVLKDNKSGDFDSLVKKL